MAKNCPWCGAPGTPIVGRRNCYDWECGSFKQGQEPWQSVECELNVAHCEIERLRARPTWLCADCINQWDLARLAAEAGRKATLAQSLDPFMQAARDAAKLRDKINETKAAEAARR